jgi:mono/diheme cytochrome c family protein
MKSRTAFVATASALILVFAGFIVLGPFDDKALLHGLRPGDAKTLAVGERIYVQRCASCHGAQLQGQPNWRTRGPDSLLPAPPHDSSGHTWHHPDELLFRITKFGVAKAANLTDYQSAMPIYEGVLSDEEIVAVLSWINSRWPASIRAKHDELNAQSLQRLNR